jgi:hypothetical protein
MRDSTALRPAPHTLEAACCLPALCLAILLGPASLWAAPVALVPQGAHDYCIDAPKVFWHTAAYCTPTPDHGPNIGAEDPELLSRVPTYGGMSRLLFERNDPRPQNACNPYRFHSEIVAGGDHVYWVDSSGLVRLSTDANPGDAPEPVSASILGNEGARKVELAMGEDAVYALTRDAQGNARIWRVRKSDGAASVIHSVGAAASDLSYDGEFVYFRRGGDLRRLAPTARGGTVTTIATGVSGYHAEGERQTRTGSTKYVFMGKGKQVVRYNNATATSVLLYTSTDSAAVVYSLTSDASRLFFFEYRPYLCPGCIFTTYNQLLFRTGRGGGAAEALYTRTSQVPASVDADLLSSADEFVFWRQSDKVMRLEADAEALPKTNMRVTDVEVTQGIQDLQNSVLLVAGKRTFVRVHVKSDGPPVAAVPCILYKVAANGAVLDGPLAPVNAGGSLLTVQSSPSRNNLDDSFLFELPWGWTSGTIRLRAELNPWKVPLQESYANNKKTAGPLTFESSPRLKVQFVAFGYDLNGTTYSPRFDKDVQQTYSWIRRAYPLATTLASFNGSEPGFAPNVWFIHDGDLGARVGRTASECKDEFCAANYTNALMDAWRVENGDSHFYYGMIWDINGPGTALFPRGRASGMVSSGPAGTDTWGWDLDGSYADWYAGHEVGHTVGRGHPAASTGCGNDAADMNYPYAGGAINPAGGTFAGFDWGDGPLGVPRAVLPGNGWFDMMSYCAMQWISDYTYEGIYDFLTGGGGAGAGGAIAGDWLSVFGYIRPEEGSAEIVRLRRLSSTGSVPPLVPGAYKIELLDAAGRLLAEHFFSPGEVDDDHHESSLGFGQVVPFVEGAREVRIAARRGGVLASRKISARPPEVSWLELAGASSPIAGEVTLEWAASDPDGDALAFDVYHLRQGKAPRPLLVGLKSPGALIDTARLPGGEGRFRVVASDGVLTAFRDTPPLLFAEKPPAVRIVLPENGIRVRYGQLVNFLGEAEDLEGNVLSGRQLTWTLGRKVLGGGPLLSADDLPVGANLITLTATGQNALSASAHVTVIVSDDLRRPGPTLSVGPAQVGWHVAQGAVGRVRSELKISNSGGGSLAWSASTDAPWLALSAASGAAPAVLGLSADPAGLPDGTVLTGKVVIKGTAAGVPPQEIVVPVSLAAGDLFAQREEVEARRFVRGDSNADGATNISDASHLLNWLFTGGAAPPCREAANVNGDARGIDLSDAAYLLNFLFRGGAPPPPPFPACGEARGEAECAAFPPCR